MMMNEWTIEREGKIESVCTREGGERSKGEREREREGKERDLIVAMTNKDGFIL